MDSCLRALAAVVLAFVLATALACSRGPAPSQTADVIYTGGDIVTANDAQPTAEALVVKEGKILAVGGRAEIEKAHKGAPTKVFDLEGKTHFFIVEYCTDPTFDTISSTISTLPLVSLSLTFLIHT